MKFIMGEYDAITLKAVCKKGAESKNIYFDPAPGT